VNPEYYEYLLKSAPLRPELIQRAKGIIEGFWRLYTDDFYDIRLPVPPVSEQEKIVAFLRQENQKIDEYIRSKRRLIELLNEQKQGIISRAVTRGLDPNVQLKPSGIEWLGNVPEHWTVERIKNFAKPSKQSFIDGDWIETPYITDEGIRLIQTGNIGIGQYREQGFRYITESTFIELKCTEVLPNDILICRLGDPVARACLAPNLGCRMITSVDVCILKPSSNYDSQFLIYAMSNQQYLDWIGSLCRGSTRDRVSRGMLGAFSLPVPPLSEQVKIRDNLNEKLSIMNDIIKVIRNDLSLIYEYRNSLISDIITGKVDIRSEKIVDIHVPSPNEIEMVHFDDGFLGSEEDD
jgi:type I restriction enzyme S subunit